MNKFGGIFAISRVAVLAPLLVRLPAFASYRWSARTRFWRPDRPQRGRSPTRATTATGFATPVDYDKTTYRQRREIENVFAKLKDCDASQRAMTDAPAHFSPRSASLPQSPSISINES